MMRWIFFFILSAVAIGLTGCKYRKGEVYTMENDSHLYAIMATGKGKSISKKILKYETKNNKKGNLVSVYYLTDSASIRDQKCILMFNSVMPDVEKDLLEKGFFGAMASKQMITYFVVSDQEFVNYFHPKN
jgi:hypothetical protein